MATTIETLKKQNGDYVLPRTRARAVSMEDGITVEGAIKTIAFAYNNISEQVNQLSSDKLNVEELPNAINTALDQAKASGEFNGKDGKTPIKGIDYWTSDDINEIVQSVLAALPMAEEASF